MVLVIKLILKNINKQIKVIYLIIFNFLIFVVLSLLYIYLKNIVESSSNDINIIYNGISIVFILLGLSIFSLSFIVYIYLKQQNNHLVEDVNSLSKHIQEISNKEYDSNIKIKYYKEFLQISLAFKNILKRLNKIKF